MKKYPWIFSPFLLTANFLDIHAWSAQRANREKMQGRHGDEAAAGECGAAGATLNRAQLFAKP
jgi:uncharacterized protein YfaQ (DUF2300 family)